MPINYDALIPLLGMNPQERLRARNTSPLVSDCRRIVAVALRKQHYSLPFIGRELARHHTTVLHLLRSHEALMEVDEQYRRFVEEYSTKMVVYPD